MTDKLTLELSDQKQARALLISQLFPYLASRLTGSSKWGLTVQRKKRTLAQNRRYWGNGVLAQIADQSVIDGKRYSVEVWHEYLKRLHLGVEELPDGSVIGKSTKGLTTVEFSEFCTRCEAWAAIEHLVTFYDLPDA